MRNSKKNEFITMITGGSGFVGSATIKLMDLMGMKWVNYDIMEGNDIRDTENLEKFILDYEPGRILHLAAIARFADADKDPLLTFETNQVGTCNVARMAQKYHIPMVYSSTGSVYMPITQTPPITEDFKVMGNSQYACSKLIGEKFVERLTPHIILRYAHIYGKEKRGHGLIGGYWDRIRRGLKPMLYGGEQSNDFCYVDDIAQANVLALNATWDKWNQVYNIGSSQELTAKYAGEIVCKVTGWKGGVEIVKGRTVDPLRFVYDITKAKVMLGYEPVYDFKAGLKAMFKK
jgi:nucleoside-diphosphate-sugar epimerase